MSGLIIAMDTVAMTSCDACPDIRKAPVVVRRLKAHGKVGFFVGIEG